MKICCPYCSRGVEIPESPRIQHNLRCPVCGNSFCSAGELVFRYGIPLESENAEKIKFGCPYCGQHYDLSFRPMNNLLGCVSCLNVFMLSFAGLPPVAASVSDPAALPTIQLPRPSSPSSESAPEDGGAPSSSESGSAPAREIPHRTRRVLCPELADPSLGSEAEEKSKKPVLKLKLKR